MIWIDRITTVAKVIWAFLKLLAELLWVMLSVSVASLYYGVPDARDRIAKDWEKRILDWSRIPTESNPAIYRAGSLVALVVMLIFWIVIAEITVLVMRLLF